VGPDSSEADLGSSWVDPSEASAPDSLAAGDPAFVRPEGVAFQVDHLDVAYLVHPEDPETLRKTRHCERIQHARSYIDKEKDHERTT